jgi:hypothetical protein
MHESRAFGAVSVPLPELKAGGAANWQAAACGGPRTGSAP